MAAPSNTFPFGSQAGNAPPASTFGFGAQAAAPQALPPTGPQPPQPAASFTSIFGQHAPPPLAAAPPHLQPQPTVPSAPGPITSLFGKPIHQPSNAPAPGWAPQPAPAAAPPAGTSTNPFGFGAANAPAAVAPAAPAAASRSSRPAMLFGKPVGQSGAAADAAEPKPGLTLGPKPAPLSGPKAGPGPAAGSFTSASQAAKPRTPTGRLFGAALAGSKLSKKDAAAAGADDGAQGRGNKASGGGTSGSRVWQRLAPADQSKAGTSPTGGLGSKLAAAAADGRPKTPWGRLTRVENGAAGGVPNVSKPATTFGFGQQQQQPQQPAGVAAGQASVGMPVAAMVSPGRGSAMEEDGDHHVGGGNVGDAADTPRSKQAGWGLGKLAVVSKAFLSGGKASEANAATSGPAPTSSQAAAVELERAKQAAMKSLLSSLKGAAKQQPPGAGGAVADGTPTQPASQIWGAARGKKNAKAQGGRGKKGEKGKKKAAPSAAETNEEEDVDEEELKRQTLAQMPSFGGAANHGRLGGKPAAAKKLPGSKAEAADEVDDEEEMKRKALASMPSFKGSGPKFGAAAKKQPAPAPVSNNEEEEDVDEEELKRRALASMPGFAGGPSQPRPSKPAPKFNASDDEDRIRQRALAAMPSFAAGSSKPGGMKAVNRRSPSPSRSPSSTALSVYEDEELEGGIVGTCDDMCPAEEVEQRKQSGQIDPFEMKGNNLVCVKKAQRNFDANMQQPHLFRTMVGLDKSMRYLRKLLDENALSPGSNPADFLRAYNFLWDRYRSVRKDVTTQAFHKSGDKLEQVLAWNEEVARFLILADHELCSLDKLYTPEKANNELQSITDLNAALQVSKYDAHLNSEQLNKTLTDLNTFYDEAKLRGIPCPNEPEFRAYFVMLSAHTHGQFGKTPGQLESFSMRQSDLILAAPIYRLALEIVVRMREGNWRGFFKAVLRAPPLLACLASLYFTSVRHVALKVITASYTMGSRDLFLEEDELVDMLCLSTESELEQLCNSHGLALQDGYVVFNKQSWENPNLMTLQKEVQRLTSAFVQKKYEHLPWSRIVTESLPPSLLPHPSAFQPSSLQTTTQPTPVLRDAEEIQRVPSLRTVPAVEPKKQPASRIVFALPGATPSTEEGAAEETEKAGDKATPAPSSARKRAASSAPEAPAPKQLTTSFPGSPAPRASSRLQPGPTGQSPQAPSPVLSMQVASPPAASIPSLPPLQLDALTPAPSVDMVDIPESPAWQQRQKRPAPQELLAPSPRTATELARQRQEQLLRQQQLVWEQEMARHREQERLRLEKEAEERRLAEVMQAFEERVRAYFLEKRVRRIAQRWRDAVAAKKEELRKRQEASRARCRVSLGIQVVPMHTAQKRSYADVATAAAYQEQVKRSRAHASKMWQALGQDKRPANVVPIIGGALSSRLPEYPFLCCHMGVWTGLMDSKAGAPIDALQLRLGDWLKAKLSNAPPEGQTYPQVQAGELLTNFSVAGHNKHGRPTRLALSILDICSSQLPTTTPPAHTPHQPLQACQALLLCSAVEPDGNLPTHRTPHNTHLATHQVNGESNSWLTPTGWTTPLPPHSNGTQGGPIFGGPHPFQQAIWKSLPVSSAPQATSRGRVVGEAERLLSVICRACTAWSADRPVPVAVLSSRPAAESGELEEQLERGLVDRGLRERVGVIQVLSVNVKESASAASVLDSTLRFLAQHMPPPPALLSQHLHQLAHSYIQPHIDFLSSKPAAPQLLIQAYNKAISATAQHIHQWITDPRHGYPHYHLPCPEMVPPDNACFLPNQLHAAVTAVQQWHLPEYPTDEGSRSMKDGGSHLGRKDARQFGFGASSDASRGTDENSVGGVEVAGLLRARSYISSLLRTWPAGTSMVPLLQKVEAAVSSMSHTALSSTPQAQSPTSIPGVALSEQHVVQELLVLAFDTLAARHTTAVLVPPVDFRPGLLELSRVWAQAVSSSGHVPVHETQLIKNQALLVASSARGTQSAAPTNADAAAVAASPVQVYVLPQQQSQSHSQSQSQSRAVPTQGATFIPASSSSLPSSSVCRTAAYPPTPADSVSPVQVRIQPAGAVPYHHVSPLQSPPEYTVLSPGQQQPTGAGPRIGDEASGLPLSVADQALNIKLMWTKSTLNDTLEKAMKTVMEGAELSEKFNELLGKLGKT